MTQRLTQEQLSQIIAEVQGLQLRRESELDQQQVKEILQELNLSPEYLDEAMIQLSRRQALEVEQKRNRWIVSGVVAALVVVIASGIILYQQQGSLLSRISSQQDRITLASGNGENLKAISRQVNPEVYYRVTLKDAPLGQKLNLSCNWIDPSGKTIKQNSFTTKAVTTAVWDTRCRYTFPPSSSVGNWKVQMLLEGRLITEEQFTVN